LTSTAELVATGPLETTAGVEPDEAINAAPICGVTASEREVKRARSREAEESKAVEQVLERAPDDKELELIETTHGTLWLRIDFNATNYDDSPFIETSGRAF
jgi:hypothetical protein